MGNAGVGLDFAMADLVISHFNEFMAAASLDPDLPVDTANELSPYAPNGVYPTIDGWVAVSVEGDEQFARFTKVLGSDAVDDAAFAGADARHDERRSLDARIAEVTRTRSASELASALRAVGVPAEKVASPADLLDSPQLASRAGSSRRSSTANGASDVSSGSRGDSSGDRRSPLALRRASNRSTRNASDSVRSLRRIMVDPRED